MKKIKNLLLIVLAVVLFGGVTNVKAAEKVKVYVFEAGGCPFCERELAYLESLSSYNEKFEIIEKQLYVDHVDWKRAKDYPLGKAVAEAFQSIGFESASYQATPFVVISDLYAAAAYSESLESVINEAYEKGDKDVVGCYEKDGENCLNGADPSIKVDWSLVPNEDEEKKVETITTVILFLVIGGVVALVAYNEKKKTSNKKLADEKPVKEEKEKVTKTVAKDTKKAGVKKEKAPAKKTVKKTNKK